MRDRASEAVRELMQPLTKGPWTAHGSVLYSGAKVIAACPGASGGAAARALADTLNAVDMILALTPAVLIDEIERSHEREGELIEEVRTLLGEMVSASGHLQESDGQGASA